MAKIDRVGILMVDLKPKTQRFDAIQSFVSQETPIVRGRVRSDAGTKPRAAGAKVLIFGEIACR